MKLFHSSKSLDPVAKHPSVFNLSNVYMGRESQCVNSYFDIHLSQVTCVPSFWHFVDLPLFARKFCNVELYNWHPRYWHIVRVGPTAANLKLFRSLWYGTTGSNYVNNTIQYIYIYIYICIYIYIYIYIYISTANMG